MVEHILIIGGGIMGVCTAYYISKDEEFQRGGISLTIVEPHEIAGGASGKAGGFLALDWHGAATASLAALSYTLHQELSAALDGERVYGYRKLASLSCRARARASEESSPANPTLAHSDPEFRPKSAGKVAGRIEWLEGLAIESVDVVAGGDTTAQVHPALFTKALFEAARARGVQYIQGRPRQYHGHTMTMDTPSGSHDIRADRVVLTAGPWSRQVAKALFDVDIPVFDLPGHSILIRPAEPLPAHAVFVSISGARDLTGAPDIFVRPDGTVYVSGENTGPTLPEGTDKVHVDADAIQKLVKASGLISEFLRSGVVETTQLCYRPVTPDDAPFVGKLTSDRQVFVAAGHGRWGITLGPGTGKVLAELVLNGVATSADISQLLPSRHLKF